MTEPGKGGEVGGVGRPKEARRKRGGWNDTTFHFDNRI